MEEDVFNNVDKGLILHDKPLSIFGDTNVRKVVDATCHKHGKKYPIQMVVTEDWEHINDANCNEILIQKLQEYYGEACYITDFIVKSINIQ